MPSGLSAICFLSWRHTAAAQKRQLPSRDLAWSVLKRTIRSTPPLRERQNLFDSGRDIKAWSTRISQRAPARRPKPAVRRVYRTQQKPQFSANTTDLPCFLAARRPNAMAKRDDDVSPASTVSSHSLSETAPRRHGPVPQRLPAGSSQPDRCSRTYDPSAS